jgi:hypothetical protein
MAPSQDQEATNASNFAAEAAVSEALRLVGWLSLFEGLGVLIFVVLLPLNAKAAIIELLFTEFLAVWLMADVFKGKVRKN